ncbi:hypothetical protein BJ912DRAFT_850336 [Pholiota molesta]|nr:hypothetical protein BJ912DRAFT_850336 [Pholiota molesta]
MSEDNQNQGGSVSSVRKRPQDALQLGPRKKPCATDPLVHHGRHFGRTVHALCNIDTLLANGIRCMGELSEEPEEAFTAQQRREHKVFHLLLRIVPGLEERLMTADSEQDIHHIASLLQKGASSARSDDTKSLKSAIIDWLSPPGQPLIPPLARNVKINRGFNHEITGALLCPAGVDWSNKDIKQKLRTGELTVAGDQWPALLYRNYKYDEDDPWNGLLQSQILIKASDPQFADVTQAFKHIFTSPSSVEKEAKATRSGNARIHGMSHVTRASIAYVATQTRFALSSAAVFTRTDMVTDSERFYGSVLDLLEDPKEIKEVDTLLAWWDRQVFPNSTASSRPVSKDSALARIKAKRAATRQSALASIDINS